MKRIAQYDGAHDNVRLALGHGIQVLVPEANELLLDLDSPEEVSEFRKRLEALNTRSSFKFIIADEFPSYTAGHMHISVKVYDSPLEPCPVKLSDTERIAYQAVLGSSYKREMNGLRRVEDRDAEPTMLFRGATFDGKKWSEIKGMPTGSDDTRR